MAKRTKLNYLLPDEKTPANEVIAEGDNLVAGLTDNPTVFVDPTPTPAEITTDLNLLKTANSVPDNEKNTLTRDLLQKRKEDFINNMLKPAANYGLFVANGDRYIAGLLGLKLSKEETNNYTPSVFSAYFVGAGPSEGTAKVRINQRAGNALFKVYLKVNDEWKLWDAFNTLTFIVTGLPSGSSQLRIIGKKGDVESPEVDITVKAI